MLSITVILSTGRFRRIAVAIATAVLFTGFLARSAEGADPVAPTVQFEYGKLVGLGSTITAIRVPIGTTDGKTLYKDITIKFEFDPDGNLMMASEYPQISASPEPLSSSFQAGRYEGPRNVANGKAVITVGGGSVGTGGTSVWSLLASDEADKCTYPGSATWYVGPLDSSPQAARLKRAGSNVGGSDRLVGITSTAWSYGVSGGGPSVSCAGSAMASGITANWENGSLIGVSQSGNTLTVASFTRYGTDYSSPVDQITYILAPKTPAVQ